ALSLSIPDLFYLFALVALVVGLVAPISLPRDAGVWLRYAADTYVCACALFVLGWVALFGALYHRSGETASEFVLELLYPLIDIVFVCGALPFVLGAARGHRRLAWMGYGALTAIAVADIVTTFVRLDGGGPADDPSDILRLAGLLLLLLVPWTGPAAAESGLPVDDVPEDETAPRERSGRMIGPGLAPAAVAAAAGLFIAGHSVTGENGLEPGVSIAAGSAALVLIARLAGLLRENDALRHAVVTGEEHFRALSESINDAVLICDMDATVQYASAGALRTYRYTPDELLGRPLSELIHPEDLPRVQDVFTEFLDDADGGVFRDGFQDALRVSCRVRAADGTWLPTESTISRYSGSDGDGAPARLLVTTRDLSEQAALQRQVAHLTFHDGLTGLPNRSYFEERVREVLSRHTSDGEVAVVFVDLDGFTAVNDSEGHAAGDQVLAQAARRLRANVLADDTVARWGGDEFAVLVQLPPDDGETRATVELAGRLLRVLSADPYQVGDKQIALTASVGIAFAGDEEEPAGAATEAAGRRLRRTAADLMRNGDLAMARAKEMGGGRVEVYAPHMHADVVRRLELGSDLQRALAEEQFAVEFQPVVDLATSRVTGVEALLRWWRGSEAVPPEEFIGPAEEAGLMVPLGGWVLREACREVARWRRDSWAVGLSVNFTARQIAAPRFVESVAAALEETGLPPHALTIEVREEVLVEDAGQNVERLVALRDLGVRLAIDDFGTGYASLAYLGQLPVDIIKIDPSFVAGLGSDETLTLLTRTIVRLGSDLGLTVVAEGIERPEQLELLREMGCPRGQGFLVARPMAAERVESLVRTNLEGRALSGDVPLPLPG
ncbi:MAG: putative bifunctional diguanylate cyclase/phosphodiesterase, partial [Spirillospora sp.]